MHTFLYLDYEATDLAPRKWMHRLNAGILRWLPPMLPTDAPLLTAQKIGGQYYFETHHAACGETTFAPADSIIVEPSISGLAALLGRAHGRSGCRWFSSDHEVLGGVRDTVTDEYGATIATPGDHQTPMPAGYIHPGARLAWRLSWVANITQLGRLYGQPWRARGGTLNLRRDMSTPHGWVLERGIGRCRVVVSPTIEAPAGSFFGLQRTDDPVEALWDMSSVFRFRWFDPRLEEHLLRHKRKQPAGGWSRFTSTEAPIP